MAGNNESSAGTATADIDQMRLRHSQDQEVWNLLDEVERLREQVAYLRWAAERAADDIERGREFDALHGLRTVLASDS